jgi:hypothetical protein
VAELYGDLACIEDRSLVYALSDDRERILVLGARPDTACNEIPLGGKTWGFFHCPDLDKLYVPVDSAHSAYLVVLDCNGDTIRGSVPLDHRAGLMAYSPVWQKLYVWPHGDAPWVLDAVADTLLRTLLLPHRGSPPVCYNPVHDKVYCRLLDTASYSVAAVNCRNDSIEAVVPVPLPVTRLHYSQALDMVLCGDDYGNVTFIDGATNEVKGSLTLPGGVTAAADAIGWDKVFAGTWACCLAVIAGEPPGTLAIGPAGWTHFTDEVRIAGSSPALVYDRAGRLVTKLQPGRNDIRSLARGVYFLRRQGETRTQKAVVIR